MRHEARDSHRHGLTYCIIRLERHLEAFVISAGSDRIQGGVYSGMTSAVSVHWSDWNAVQRWLERGVNALWCPDVKVIRCCSLLDFEHNIYGVIEVLKLQGKRIGNSRGTMWHATPSNTRIERVAARIQLRFGLVFAMLRSISELGTWRYCFSPGNRFGEILFTPAFDRTAAEAPGRVWVSFAQTYLWHKRSLDVCRRHIIYM